MAIFAQRAGMLCISRTIAMQARPALALGLLSVLFGAALAAWKIKPFSGRQPLRRRLRHVRRLVKAALDLPPLVIKLLANPLVEGYVRRTVLRAVSRKLGR
jgi:hypothetical protein